VIGVSVWGGLVAFVGPTFDFDTGTTTRAWMWTQSHWTLGVAPAALGILGGLMIAMPGRVAVERLGAVFEGVRRAHMPAQDGSIRDSAYYSVVRAEWPAVRKTLEGALAR